MYCKKCGKEIENDSLFCTYCGCKQGISKGIKEDNDLSVKTQKKVFDFSTFAFNAESTSIVNDWLASQSIEIISWKIFSQFTNMIRRETAIRHLEIVYVEKENMDYRYQMGYVSACTIFANSYKTMQKGYDKWVNDNPDKVIAFESVLGHDTNSDNTTSVFFLYKESNQFPVKVRVKRTIAPMSLLSVILLFGWYTAPIGVIVAIIDLLINRKDGNSHLISLVVVLAGLFFLSLFCLTYSINS